MKLQMIDIGNLDESVANIRSGKKPPDVTNILPSVLKRGVLQSILVRDEGKPGRFGVLAGRRRFHAALAAAEAGVLTQVPCGVLEEGDDADAIEASMIENMVRADVDEVTRWTSFTRLVKEGRTVEDIAATFALPELIVKRTLALGNLLPRIRELYRAGKLDAATVRHLTMASKSQQKTWLTLYDDPDAYVPTAHQLKAWLFGGQSIKAEHALFDVEASGVTTVADLFGEDRYFADPDAFWTAQNAAIEANRTAYLKAGWSDVVIVPPSDHFQSWEYEKAGKRKGGRVYVDVRSSGEVAFHEGYVSRKEARRSEKGEQTGGTKPARPEVTSSMQTYLDLHRHAAVRAALIGHPQVALRLMVAHAIAGSHLFRVTPEPQTARNDATAESLENSLGEGVFDEHRRAILAVLDMDPETETITGRYGDSYRQARIFLRLLDLPDTVVMEVLTIVMGEALASGSAAVEVVGVHLNVDMADWWQADDAFFELIRDREVLVAMVGDVAGKVVAEANATEKTKVLKRIIADHLAGAGGRDKVEKWVPGWMAFPPSAYTARGGVGTVAAHATVEAARIPDEQPDPDVPDATDLPEEEERLAA